jgi:protein O-GlcNAc transferase
MNEKQILDKILNYEFTEIEKLDIVKKHIIINNIIKELVNKSNYIKAMDLLNQICSSVDVTEYLLLNCNPRISKTILLESLFTLGTLLKMKSEEEIQIKIKTLHQNNANRTTNVDTKLTQFEQALLNKSLYLFITILQIDFENKSAIKQIVSIYSQLTFIFQSNLEQSLNYLKQSLLYDPSNPAIHYNIAHIYQRMNNLAESIIHYKISLKLTESRNFDETEDHDEKRKLILNDYNGIASVYRSIKKWPEALYYLLKAHTIDNLDPDINNQLGVTYTEMRETEIAEKHYQLAIDNYFRTFISTDPKFFLSEIYLNFGHKFSYDGNNNKSIECYNLALKNVPKFHLAYQNKIMNLNYIFDQLEDPMYITNQHKLINKLLTKNPKPYTFGKEFFNSEKINIGIISGDFLDHPVSYFIVTYLKNFDHTKFNVTCYSEAVIRTDLYNPKLKFKLIKHMSQTQASNLIYNDNIHILLDLAGHTGFNRLDIFSYKSAPIQISYIGYPATTGLNEMDYRITDNICDNIEISQKFYTEKLLMLKNCFTCYDPIIELPQLKKTPRLSCLNELIIGCFNRINKITDSVIIEFNKILLKCSNVKFLFKTKALINLKVRKEFIEKFDKSVQNKIIILDCTLSHFNHLETYNQMDIAIDTKVYSGTTTTCEALACGVPVFAWHDKTWWCHASNVSASILKNSDLDFYVCNNTEEIIEKIKILEQKPIEFWKTLKIETKNKFLNGFVCNKKEYLKNLERLFIDLYNKHSIT